MEIVKEINKDVQDFIFNELVDMHDYWGENNCIEMIDFCKRNQLSELKKMITTLMKPDRIKTSN